MARPSLFQHRKFKRLVGVLGLPRPQVVGILEMLWHVAYEDGQPNVGDSLSVEHAAEWWGKRGALVDALVECGFLDREADGTYAIHDLFEHAPDYVRKRRTRSDERRAKAAAMRRAADNGGQRRTTADADRTTAPNGRTPAPAPAPNPKDNPPLPPSGGESADKPDASPRRKTKDLPPVPDGLHTDDFLAAWSDWLAYRVERGRPVVPKSAAELLKRLTVWGPERAALAIRDSIANGYQGVFLPSAKPSNGRAKASATPTQDAIDRVFPVGGDA